MRGILSKYDEVTPLETPAWVDYVIRKTTDGLGVSVPHGRTAHRV